MSVGQSGQLSLPTLPKIQRHSGNNVGKSRIAVESAVRQQSMSSLRGVIQHRQNCKPDRLPIEALFEALNNLKRSTIGSTPLMSTQHEDG